MFAYDALGTYENEVAGIGRDDASNFHQDAQGTAIVRINTPSSLNDGDYLFFGHDNASFTLSNTVDVPVGIDNRLERVWRVDETGNIGTVTIDVDLSSFTIGNSNDLVLLIDSVKVLSLEIVFFLALELMEKSFFKTNTTKI